MCLNSCGTNYPHRAINIDKIKHSCFRTFDLGGKGEAYVSTNHSPSKQEPRKATHQITIIQYHHDVHLRNHADPLNGPEHKLSTTISSKMKNQLPPALSPLHNSFHVWWQTSNIGKPIIFNWTYTKIQATQPVDPWSEKMNNESVSMISTGSSYRVVFVDVFSMQDLLVQPSLTNSNSKSSFSTP